MKTGAMMIRLLCGSARRCVLAVTLVSSQVGSSMAADSLHSVPVRVLSAPAAEPPAPADTGQPAREEPEPATPGARLPQYQLHHLDRGQSATDAGNAELRFILALPRRPLIVQASITIDGQPFARTREERVQEILEFAADPDGFKARLAR